MIEYFEKQLNSKGKKPIAESDLKKLKGRSYYGKYEAGDLFLMFMEQIRKPSDKPIYDEEITLRLYTVVDRDLDKLSEEFEFVRMATNSIPVLEKKHE
jgi:hypothetical protein